MNSELLNWLKIYFDAKDAKDIEKALSDELGLSFLIVWSIIESKVFDGFLKKDKIKKYSEMLSKYYNELEIDNIAYYFHERYQDKRKYKNLKHGKDYLISDEIIQSLKFDELEEEQKVYLIIFVVYRYRNNIFHGNKGYESWCNYKVPIENCITCMIKIYDCFIEHNLNLFKKSQPKIQ